MTPSAPGDGAHAREATAADRSFAAEAAAYKGRPTGGSAPFAPFASSAAIEWESRGAEGSGTRREVALLAEPGRVGNAHVSVALARIPAGGSAPWHFHADHEEFTYFLEGSGELWCDGELVASVEPGCVNVIPPNVWHTHRALESDLLFVWGYAPPGRQLSA